MWKRIALLFSLPVAVLAARDKTESWIQVRSEHFIVATNSNEKQGRRVADQFERMRSVFHIAFPKMQIDPGTPIIVLAIKDEKDFRALEPESYLAKGQLRLGGLFLRAPDKNYVLMRLDAEGEHPYSVVYHEYTHLLLAKTAEWLPLWMNEGLAEFYQNTEIRDKEVVVGEPSTENILLLRGERMLPLATLLTVDHTSPYYHEENKGSIFYAESWALTHYLQVKDSEEKTHRVSDYMELLIKGTDPVTAATRAFGDLKAVGSALESYIRQERFSSFKLPAMTEVDQSAFKVAALAPAQADALRADFLAYNDRTGDARTLLDRVLKDDPNNVSAHETMGFLEFRQGHVQEARKAYAQAVQLDSQNYLAHYYFAAMSMNGSADKPGEAQVESSLRTAIKLNPSFAPPYDRLAVLLGIGRRNLDEARMMGLTAVSLEPENVGYRVNVANVLLIMGNVDGAIQVLRAAEKLAKSPEEAELVENNLMHAQAYSAAQQQNVEQNQRIELDAKAARREVPGEEEGQAGGPGLLRREEFGARGPHRYIEGLLKDVRCDSANLDLTVASSGKSLALHTDNYFKIRFTALGLQPTGDLHPCADLEGRQAKVEYVESAEESDRARLLAVELHQ
jgi:tetratricopeptide (TPR) repeat protein